MRVAFASSTGARIDEHFGSAEHFHIWEVGPDEAQPISKVSFCTPGEEVEDKIVGRATALDGCALVYSVQIGGPAAAKLVRRHIQPLKAREGTPVAEIVGKLQEVLRGAPPPWLRRAAGLPGVERPRELPDAECE